MMGLGRTGMGLYVLPDPDGVISTPDRVQYLYLYPGIIPSGAAPAFDNAGAWFVQDRRRDRLPKLRGPG